MPRQDALLLDGTLPWIVGLFVGIVAFMFIHFFFLCKKRRIQKNQNIRKKNNGR